MELDKRGLAECLNSIGSSIDTKVSTLVIGKAYMVLEGFFPSTGSLDLIVGSEKDVTCIESALISIDYKKYEVSAEYKEFGMVGIYDGPIRINVFLMSKVWEELYKKSKGFGKYSNLEVGSIGQDDLDDILKV